MTGVAEQVQLTNTVLKINAWIFVGVLLISKTLIMSRLSGDSQKHKLQFEVVYFSWGICSCQMFLVHIL